jgi:hypothetical protein
MHFDNHAHIWYASWINNSIKHNCQLFGERFECILIILCIYNIHNEYSIASYITVQSNDSYVWCYESFMMHIIYAHNYQSAFQTATNQMTVMYGAMNYSWCILYMYIIIKMHFKLPPIKWLLCMMLLNIHYVYYICTKLSKCIQNVHQTVDSYVWCWNALW